MGADMRILPRRKVLLGALAAGVPVEAALLLRGGAAQAQGALTPGIARATQVKATYVSLVASDATGGSGIYTYKWYQSSTSGQLGSAVLDSNTPNIYRGNDAETLGVTIGEPRNNPQAHTQLPL